MSGEIEPYNSHGIPEQIIGQFVRHYNFAEASNADPVIVIEDRHAVRMFAINSGLSTEQIALAAELGKQQYQARYNQSAE
jgi:hypothetical protein